MEFEKETIEMMKDFPAGIQVKLDDFDMTEVSRHIEGSIEKLKPGMYLLTSRVGSDFLLTDNSGEVNMYELKLRMQSVPFTGRNFEKITESELAHRIYMNIKRGHELIAFEHDL